MFETGSSCEWISMFHTQHWRLSAPAWWDQSCVQVATHDSIEKDASPVCLRLDP